MDTTAYLTTVYVLGAERNIGKAVTSIGIISTLLAPEHGYCIDDIGYIKPVGQQTVKVPGRDGATLDEDALRGFLDGRISAHKIPSTVWFRTEALPRNRLASLTIRRACASEMTGCCQRMARARISPARTRP